MMSVDAVAVIGAGAVGLSAARALSDRGIDVTLFERDRPGSGSTGRAAGICYDAYADRRDAAIARDSLEWYREQGLLDEQPYLWAARDEGSVAAAIREQVERMAARGLDVSLLSGEAVAERFPSLRAGDITVAGLARNAGCVDPDAVVELLVERVRENGVGVRLEPVTLAAETAVETSDGTESFDAVLVAAGAGTRHLLSGIGIDLAVGLYRAQAIEATVDLGGKAPIFYDASERFYARPTSAGVITGNGAHAYEGIVDGAGGADVDGVGGRDDRQDAHDADDAFIDQTCDRIEHRFGSKPTVRDAWAGLCTATPDLDPLLGTCAPDVYVAAGWHGHGLMRAPAMGERIAAQIAGEDMSPFDPLRFDGDEEITLPDGIVE